MTTAARGSTPASGISVCRRGSTASTRRAGGRRTASFASKCARSNARGPFGERHRSPAAAGERCRCGLVPKQEFGNEKSHCSRRRGPGPVEYLRRCPVIQTVEAVIDGNGQVRLLGEVHVTGP